VTGLPSPGSPVTGSPLVGSPVTTSAASAGTSLPTTNGVPSRVAFFAIPRLVIFVVALLWIGVLVGLVLTAGNPVELNRTQLLHAQLVVLGTWQADRPGVLLVERSWKQPIAAKTITIDAAPQVPANGQRWLIPLTAVAPDRFRITGGPLLNLSTDPLVEPVPSLVPALMYPADESVIAQLETFLAQATAPAGPAAKALPLEP
jgi:hypothetical protein